MTAIAKDYTRCGPSFTEEQCCEFSATRHLNNIDLLQYLQSALKIHWNKVFIGYKCKLPL